MANFLYNFLIYVSFFSGFFYQSFNILICSIPVTFITENIFQLLGIEPGVALKIHYLMYCNIPTT